MSSDDQSTYAAHDRGVSFRIIPVCWVCLTLLDAVVGQWDATPVAPQARCAACGGPAMVEVRAPEGSDGSIGAAGSERFRHAGSADAQPPPDAADEVPDPPRG